MVVVVGESDGVIISKAQECYPQAHLASRLDGRSSQAQPTHMRSLSRRLIFHTNRDRHMLNPDGQLSIKMACRRHLQRMRFALMVVSAGYP
jgi:hypothetical protein